MRLFPKVRYGTCAEGRCKYQGTAVAALYSPQNIEIVISPRRWLPHVLAQMLLHELLHHLFMFLRKERVIGFLDDLLDWVDFTVTQRGRMKPYYQRCLVR